jgi:hypothetical protein
MLKKIAPVAMAVVTLVSLAACSKAADPVNNGSAGVTSAPAQTSSTSSPGTTEKRTTETTKPRSPGTTGATHSTGTTKSSSDFDLTDDESTCISDAVTNNPDIASAFSGDTSNLTPEQAGIVGGLIAGCVPKPKIADGLVNDLKNSSDGRDLTQSQLSCIRDQIISLDKNDLAVFIGLIGYSQDSGDRSVAATTISDLNSACGTRIPA